MVSVLLAIALAQSAPATAFEAQSRQVRASILDFRPLIDREWCMDTPAELAARQQVLVGSAWATGRRIQGRAAIG